MKWPSSSCFLGLVILLLCQSSIAEEAVTCSSKTPEPIFIADKKLEVVKLGVRKPLVLYYLLEGSTELHKTSDCRNIQFDTESSNIYFCPLDKRTTLRVVLDKDRNPVVCKISLIVNENNPRQSIREPYEPPPFQGIFK